MVFTIPLPSRAMKVEDAPKHQGLRRRLIEELRQKGIHNEQVLKAMMEVPRHLFFDSAFLDFAYADKAFPIQAGQTISQPYTVAFQSDLLAAKPRMHVLEIGTGSGYQAAVLSRMGMRVWTIERQRALYKRSQEIFKALRLPVKGFYGDGYKGLPSFAPFDRVLVTCGAPELPQKLIEQMGEGGVMVVPIGAGSEQVMTRIEKTAEGEIIQSEHGTFRFVPMLQDKSKAS